MTKFIVDFTYNFKKGYKRVKKQGKDISKLDNVIKQLTNGIMLEPNIGITNYMIIKNLKIVENVILNQIGC